MSNDDKKVLLAKIDALRWSFADTQMQAIMATMYDLVVSIKSTESTEMGFRQENK